MSRDRRREVEGAGAWSSCGRLFQDRQVSHTNDITYGEERHKQDARGAQYRFVDFVLHFLRLYDLEQDAALSFTKAAWMLARQSFVSGCRSRGAIFKPTQQREAISKQ